MKIHHPTTQKGAFIWIGKWEVIVEKPIVCVKHGTLVGTGCKKCMEKKK